MTTPPSALQSFIIGRERQPTLENDVPGNAVAPDPAQALLETLATENLVAKAAFPLHHTGIPAPVAAASAGHPCGEAAAKDLTGILTGRYGGILPLFYTGATL